MKTKSCNRAITTVSIIGILLSTYALYVELAAEYRPGYKALCDIAERVSCSRVLTSEYAKGFGLLPKDSPFVIPNCVYGIIFYCIMIFLATIDNSWVVRLQLLLALGSIASCCYLAYLLAFVLKDVCVVCISTYVVNAILLALVHKKNKLLAIKNK